MISVVVPVYNTEKYLDQCIQSILSQTYTDFELLLIDDGSTDFSGVICDKYAVQDSRIRVFHKPNGGVSSARNMGLDNVNGEWITFCDADDYVEDNWLDNFIYNAEGCELVCQSINVFQNDCKFDYYHLKTAYFESPSNVIYELNNSWQMLGSLCNKLFKTNIIKRNSLYFNEEIKFCEDTEFVTRYLKYVNRMYNIDGGGYNYRYMYNGKYDNVDVFPVLSMIYENVRAIPGVSQKELKPFQKDLINECIASLGKTNIPLCTKIRHIIEYFKLCGRYSVSTYAISCFVSKFKGYVGKIKK